MNTADSRSLRILLVAPQPFFAERGTPIAVRMLAEALLSEGHAVELLTLPLGEEVVVPGLTIHRCARIPGVTAVPIGISVSKLLYDAMLSLSLARRMLFVGYDVVHVVEEAVFPAIALNVLARRKLVYDMDSALSEQLLQKWTWLRWAAGAIAAIERRAIGRVDAIFAVCEDLAVRARRWVPPERVFVVPDVALEAPDDRPPADDLRVLSGFSDSLILYVGNLEPYQGIDLLLQAMLRVEMRDAGLVLIGGDEAGVQALRTQAESLGVGARVRFLGPRPLACLPDYLAQATVLVSPRTRGDNTPMKIYSYMQSGRPIVATRIRSHTQVLDDECAILTEVCPASLADGLSLALRDRDRATALGCEARRRATDRHSMAVFRSQVGAAYRSLQVRSGA
ncbi:MAG: glycosyltransferase family 4 protein [Burkholderiaceae bacterium]|nr:glycosyltransferase family 4 protein [Burkholderiaceae bacterium]